MNHKLMNLCLSAVIASPIAAQQGMPTPQLKSDLMTPEVLWSFGRIGSFDAAPNHKDAVYAVTYYSKEKNKGTTHLNLLDLDEKTVKVVPFQHTSMTAPHYIHNGEKIVYLSAQSGSNQLWMMNADGSGQKQISFTHSDVIDYLFAPNEKQVILIQEVPQTASIEAKEKDLPLSSGMVINDLMYKHWDHYVTAIPHPFVATFENDKVGEGVDILEGEPYECPTEPFGGIEELCWSPDSKEIAYTCRKKVGVQYAISTDTDIYLYDLKNKTTKNLCKPADFHEPQIDTVRSMQQQTINTQHRDDNMGYDVAPQFSPDGKYIAWTSMQRDGYESDRTRLCVYDLKTGKKTYVTESFESGVNQFVWANDSKTLYFTGVWHGTTQIYSTNLKGKVRKITDGQWDYSLLTLGHKDNVFAKRHSMSAADEIYSVNLKDGKATQISFENKGFYDQLTMGEVNPRWIKTFDNKDMLAWVIYPPHFDPNKKYPTLLFCEGGPQSPVSQFWSYRWNMQMMAAKGYIIIAPNRRGLPGFGMQWLEEISGDYTGKCMKDYLSAIDNIAQEPYVDSEHLGAVGASFGGFSVYWLAGNHNKRFKAFIAHDGIYNTQQQYVETEEMWFPNWDLESAPWVKQANGDMQKAYATSPHLYVQNWDTPILCIHGQKDFRIEYTQAQSAFAAAKLRGVPAQLLLFPDENHWVLRPQNGILWQRTFFRWLDKWLKK